MDQLTDLQRQVLEVLHDRGTRRYQDLHRQLGCDGEALRVALQKLLDAGYIGKLPGQGGYFLKARRAW